MVARYEIYPHPTSNSIIQAQPEPQSNLDDAADKETTGAPTRVLRPSPKPASQQNIIAVDTRKLKARVNANPDADAAIRTAEPDTVIVEQKSKVR